MNVLTVSKDSVSRLVGNISTEFQSLINSVQSRKILQYLTVVMITFSCILIGFSGYLTNLFYNKDNINDTNYLNWLGTLFVGIFLLIVCIIGNRGAQTVNLGYLLAYFWGITVFIAPILIGIVACFDFYEFVSMWFTHSWSNDSFAGVRQLFCNPVSSADSYCAAPIGGGYNYSTVTDWCIGEYNSTVCEGIQSTSINDAVTFGQSLAIIQAIISCGILFIILLSMYVCFRVLTKEVITESMNDVINYLLFVPLAGCIGIYIGMRTWSDYGGVKFVWFSKLYLALSIGIFLSIPLGIFAGKFKFQLLMTIYMLLILLCLSGLVIGGSFGIIYSRLLTDVFVPIESDVDYIACKKQLSGCCCCDEQLSSYDDSARMCPEWSSEEIASLLSLELKIYSVISCVSVAYLIGAVTVGGFMRQNILNYKSDFV